MSDKILKNWMTNSYSNRFQNIEMFNKKSTFKALKKSTHISFFCQLLYTLVN